MKKYFIVSLVLASSVCRAGNPDEAVTICSIDGCHQHLPVEGELAANPNLSEQVSLFMGNLFSTDLWPPRWHCGTWTEFHGWLYILSDIGIWGAYFAIPLVLGLFLFKRRRTGLPYPGIVLLFMLFIFACGLTHLIDAIIFWQPVYNLSAFIRFVTAIVSIGTVFALVKILPMAIKFKSPEELEKIISERTQQLELTNKKLAEVNEQLAKQIGEKERAREEVNTILKSLPQITWTTSPQGELTYVNEQWWHYSGLKPSDAGNWAKVIHADDMETIRTQWVESLREKRILQTEARLISADGSYRWFLIKAVPISNEKNEVLKWIGTFTDINDRKIYEQRQDTFLNIASHELRTPLTVIRAYSELIQRHEFIKESDDLMLYTSRVDTHIKKLESLILELLDVSRIANGKMHYDMHDEDFDKVIEDCVFDFKNIVRASHQIHLVGKTEALVHCDKNKINQVLHNLLMNAIRYSEADKPVTIQLSKSDTKVFCLVKDYGQGIPPEEIKDIFKRFFRSSNNSIPGGLGLGLYISDEIVKSHKGELSAQSEQGKGAEFIFSLPMAEKSVLV